MPNLVWVLTSYDDYDEGEVVEGVFSTPDLAGEWGLAVTGRRAYEITAYTIDAPVREDQRSWP